MTTSSPNSSCNLWPLPTGKTKRTHPGIVIKPANLISILWRVFFLIPGSSRHDACARHEVVGLHSIHLPFGNARNHTASPASCILFVIPAAGCCRRSRTNVRIGIAYRFPTLWGFPPKKRVAWNNTKKRWTLPCLFHYYCSMFAREESDGESMQPFFPG